MIKPVFFIIKLKGKKKREKKIGDQTSFALKFILSGISPSVLKLPYLWA
jgi:hypothetical protein